MKQLIIFGTLLSASICQVSGQINSPDAQGYLDRGTAMTASDRNYAGTVDQLTKMQSLPASELQSEEALFSLAVAHLQTGDDDALPLLERFIKQYPVSPRRAEAISLIGDYYWNRGDYADALKQYESVDHIALPSARRDEMSFRTGYAYMLLGEDATAESCFRTLLGKKKWRSTAQFYLGYLAYQRRDFSTALQYLRDVDTAEAPGNAAPYYISQIEFAEGRYQEALDAARRLLASGSVSEFAPECNRIAGESLYNLGQTAQGVPYLWKYCAEAPNPQPSAFYILGVDEFEKGHTDEAVKLLQQATDNPSAMGQSAWLFLGQAYKKRGDNSSALLSFEKAYRMNFDPKVREEAFYNYAVARMDGGRVPFGNSVDMLQEFLNEYPSSVYAPEVEQYIVEGYMTGGDYESALAAIRKASSPTPAMEKARQRALFVLGTRAFAAGRTADAIRNLREAQTVKGGDAEIDAQCLLWLGDALYTRGDYDAAARNYLDYLAGKPSPSGENKMLALYGLGYTRFSQERFADAATDFSRAASAAEPLSPEVKASLLPDIFNRLADCRYYQNDYAGALKDYQKAYSLSPSTGDYPLYQSAIMMGRLKDHKGKIATLNKLIADYPASGLTAQAMLDKAESQSAIGLTSEAVDTYTQLVENYASSAPGRNGYLQLAITYINIGERTKGIDTYKKVITTFPTSEEARIAADDLKQIYAADGHLSEFVSFIGSVPGAPTYEPSDLEKAAFQAAENSYINTGATAGLTSYVDNYPQGASRAQAFFYLADAAWNAGDSRGAQKYATSVLLNHPDSEVAEDALLIKAKAEMEMGKTEIAHSSFLELESKASGSNMLREAHLGIMRTAADMGRYADVVAVADKMLATSAAASSAELAEVRFMRAISNDRLGNRDDAYSDWAILERDLRDTYGAKSAFYHGQSLLDAGLTSQAKEVIDALISSDTPQAYWLARGFILYSDLLRKEGNSFEADEYLKSLRTNYPGSEADIFEMIESRLKK
ncbi:MAG: tetratricopeptide repeat protein [Duncaniella sp.]|nr:tetratricopeptide repeat protein [Duncaniella sp.]